jgi:hypothetical protein
MTSAKQRCMGERETAKGEGTMADTDKIRGKGGVHAWESGNTYAKTAR